MASVMSQVAVPTIQAPSGSGSASLLNVARGAFTDIGRNAESALDRLIEKERLQKEEARQAMLDQEKLADRQYMLAQREKLAKEEVAKDVFNKAIIEGPQVIGGIMTDRYNLQNQAAKDSFEILPTDNPMQQAAKLKAQEEFSKNYTNLYDTGKINETRAEMIQRAAGLALKPGEIMPQEIVTQLDQAKLTQEQARLNSLEDLQKEKLADEKALQDLYFKLATAQSEHGTGGTSGGSGKGSTKKVDAALTKGHNSIYDLVGKMSNVPDQDKGEVIEKAKEVYNKSLLDLQRQGLQPDPTSLAQAVTGKIKQTWKPGYTPNMVMGFFKDPVKPSIEKHLVQQLSQRDLSMIPANTDADTDSSSSGGKAPKDTRPIQVVANEYIKEVRGRLQGYEAKKKALEMSPMERRNAGIDALLKGIKPTVPEAKVKDKKVESAKPKKTSKNTDKKVIAKATVEAVEAKPVEKPKKQTVKNTLSEQVKNTPTTLTLDAVKKQLQTPEDYTQIEIKKAAAANAIMAERIKGRYKGKTAEQWKALAK